MPWVNFYDDEESEVLRFASFEEDAVQRIMVLGGSTLTERIVSFLSVHDMLEGEILVGTPDQAGLFESRIAAIDEENKSRAHVAEDLAILFGFEGAGKLASLLHDKMEDFAPLVAIVTADYAEYPKPRKVNKGFYLKNEATRFRGGKASRYKNGNTRRR